MRPPDDVFVGDIVIYAERIRRHLGDVGRDAFMADEVLSAAVAYWLQNVGEACRGLSPAYRKQRPDVPWRRIIGMRNIIAHEYSRLDLRRVWNAATLELPLLLEAVVDES